MRLAFLSTCFLKRKKNQLLRLNLAFETIKMGSYSGVARNKSTCFAEPVYILFVCRSKNKRPEEGK